MTVRDLIAELIRHDPYADVMVAIPHLGAIEVTRVETFTRPTERVVVDTTGVVVRKHIMPGSADAFVLLRCGGE